MKLINHQEKGKIEIINFVSNFKNYEKEKSGRKANTVRTNLPEWKKKKLKEATHIKIRKGYTKEFFIRKITDKTYWDGIDIISWDSGEK